MELSAGLKIIANSHYFFQLEVKAKVSTGLLDILLHQGVVKLLGVPVVLLLIIHGMEGGSSIKGTVLVVISSVNVKIFHVLNLIFSVYRTLRQSLSLMLSSKDLWLVLLCHFI